MLQEMIHGLAVVVAAGVSLLGQMPPGGLPDIPRMVLHPVEAVEAPLEGSGFYGSPVCDSEGNIYLRTDAFLTVDKNPVWKISPEGRKAAVFAPPPEPDASGKNTRLGEFTVSARGDFYALMYDADAAEEVYSLLSYASDGTASSTTRLQLPPHFRIDKVAVFASGYILASGHFSKKALEALQGEPRVFVLGADGSPAGEVRLSGEATRKFEEPAPPSKGGALQGVKIPQNSVSMGEDGNAYLLRGPEVLVISPRGELLRTIPLPAPAPGFSATDVQVSHGLLSVTYYKPEVGQWKGVDVMFRTFNPSTGMVQAEYVPGADVGKGALCFDGKGYTFFGTKDGKPALVRAWVR